MEIIHETSSSDFVFGLLGLPFHDWGGVAVVKFSQSTPNDDHHKETGVTRAADRAILKWKTPTKGPSYQTPPLPKPVACSL